MKKNKIGIILLLLVLSIFWIKHKGQNDSNNFRQATIITNIPQRDIISKILNGKTTVSSVELSDFNDNSKINSAYLELYENVNKLRPNLDELDYLAASSLIGKNAQIKQSIFRNLLIQIAYMDKNKRVKLNPAYSNKLLELVAKHFPGIITQFQIENPHSAVLTMFQNKKEII